MKPLRAKSPSKRGQAGELLTVHLQATLDVLLRIRARIGDIPGMPRAYWTWAALAALLHDAGKLPDGFQRMIGNTSAPALPWLERHEVLSLGFVETLLADLPAEQRQWVATVVAAHHRPFTAQLDHTPKRPVFVQYGDDEAEDFTDRFLPADQQRATELMGWLHATARSYGLPVVGAVPALSVRELARAAHRSFQTVFERWETPLFPDGGVGRTAVLLLGAVTMADHLSSAHSPLETDHPLRPDYPERMAERLAGQGHTIRPQQIEAGEVTGHLLLRSWTGSGKTEAVLLWARNQINDLASQGRGTPRLFYLLPYLASINAMVGRLNEDLESPEGIGVAHSRAASYHLARSLSDGCAGSDDEDDVDPADKAHSRAEATKNFRELVRVGTPYQLLRGALAGPAHSSILVDSANSVFVLDELHAYDARRLGMILAMTRLWADLGGRIAVLSATLPNALADLVRSTLRDDTTLVEPAPSNPPPVRHRLHVREAHLTAASSLDEMREHLAQNRSLLVVANNVRDAIALYSSLMPLCVELHGEGSAYLLHSRFRRMDRDRIEAAVHERFGARRPRRPGLLVGTQALEVSLNLDLDVCHTSAADLEALVQRFGRVNRLAYLKPAPVVVHQAAYAPRRGSGGEIWADGVYEAEPTAAGWDILTRHDGRTIDEQVITTWLDEIYDSPWGTEWRSQVEAHRKYFEQSFLTFAYPFDDRSKLAKTFDELFQGTEAVLSTDLDDYAEVLNDAPERRSGRLYAEQYLLPLPVWGKGLSRYHKSLNVHVIDAEYDPALGLLALHPDPQRQYQPGEVI